ncbi:hypothetical protein GF406_16440 [candidate division KSB1 bacterium]|nr:hypothetical protein [candidate division KSB1 bacterium]
MRCYILKVYKKTPTSVIQQGRLVMAEKRLLDQVRDVLRVKHYSLKTEKAYLHWITRFVIYHNKQHPRDWEGPKSVNSSLILPAMLMSQLLRKIRPSMLSYFSIKMCCTWTPVSSGISIGPKNRDACRSF